MSSYIQIPNSILDITKKKEFETKHRTKFEEAVIYAAIRNEIKDRSLKASYSQTELSELFKTTERTINSYVADLKQLGLLKVVELRQGKETYPHNVYKFDIQTDNYFMILPPFIYDGNISMKLKGLLLIIKANCWAGTNFVCFNGITTDLADKLGVGKNSIEGYLEELKSKGYIRFIGKSLHIINENFPLSIENDVWNVTYQIIYDYCLKHDKRPPIKNVDKNRKDKRLSYIIAEYATDYDRLRNTLNERCKNLPEDLSLEYFCQVLLNKKPTREDKAYTPLILQ